MEREYDHSIPFAVASFLQLSDTHTRSHFEILSEEPESGLQQFYTLSGEHKSAFRLLEEWRIGKETEMWKSKQARQREARKIGKMAQHKN